MKTDGTVTDLIKLLAKEPLDVIKLHEQVREKSQEKIVDRHIYLQGNHSKIKWLYAESQLFLENLPQKFVDDLIHKSIPIGSLWATHKIETFKQITDEYAEESCDFSQRQDQKPVTALVRTYNVFHRNKRAMKITEKFKISHFINLL